MDILRPSEEVMAQMTDSQRRLVNFVIENATQINGIETTPDILRQGHRELGKRMIMLAAIVDKDATAEQPANKDGNIVYSTGVVIQQGGLMFDVESIEFDSSDGTFTRFVNGEPQIAEDDRVVRVAPGDPTLDHDINTFFETYELK